MTALSTTEQNQPNSFVADVQKVFRPPTAPEVARLTYEELPDLRISVQEEARNYFAHLLNRGSPLE